MGAVCGTVNTYITLRCVPVEGDDYVAEARLSRRAVEVVAEILVPTLGGIDDEGESANNIKKLFLKMHFGMYSGENTCKCLYTSARGVCGNCVEQWIAGKERFKIRRVPALAYSQALW